MLETTFGNLLRKYRDQKNLKLEDLAKKADVSPSYISLLIHGKKGKPRGPVIERLAQALELTEAEKLEFQAAAEMSRVSSLPNQMLQRLPYMLPAEAGIEAVHRSLSLDLLNEYFPKAKKLVRIQENWLQDLFTYNTLLRDLLKKEKPLVQILLLNPESETKLADIRENALNMPEEGYLRRQINSGIKVFEDIYREFGSKYIEMRLFDVLPSVQHIAFDETMFIGFYTHTARSQSAYQLQIKAGTALGNFFEEDFNKVWGMAKRKIPK
jgi:transcriptional regulator with XRE-family HTH domain